MTLYTKDGCPPQSLPASDVRLNDGFLLMPLEGHPESATACGWQDVPSPPAIDETIERLGWDGDAWTIEPLSSDELAARRAATVATAIAAVEERTADAFLAGFPPALAEFAGERLQVRNSEDRTNWLTSQASYTAAVGAGFGDVVDASFRTAGNATVTVSYAEGLQVLLGMAAWGRAIMSRSWALKDAINADQPYDLEAGWPA